jgi:hypothetical protein
MNRFPLSNCPWKPEVGPMAAGWTTCAGRLAVAGLAMATPARLPMNATTERMTARNLIRPRKALLGRRARLGSVISRTPIEELELPRATPIPEPAGAVARKHLDLDLSLLER